MERPNILLITVDCLRADHLSCYGYHRNTIPLINEYLEDGFTIYKNHLSNGPGTPDSFPSIMCSRYRMEVPDGNRLPRKWTKISTMLKEHGYRTVGLSSGNPFVSRLFGYDHGFDVFDDGMDDGPSNIFERDEWGRVRIAVRDVFEVLFDDIMGRKCDKDLGFANLAIEHLEELTDKKPWFMWVHYMDVHGPYSPAKMVFGRNRLRFPYYSKLLNKMVLKDTHLRIDLRQDLVDMYDSTISQVDTNISMLLEHLRSSKAMDNTMIVITADHGEGFEEHGMWSHPYYGVYEEQLRIPLMIKYPGHTPNTIIHDHERTCAADILPTLADVVGCYEPPVTRGNSILRLKDVRNGHRLIFHEGRHTRYMRPGDEFPAMVRGVTYGNYGMVVESSDGWTNKRMYDMRVDVKEEKNIVGDAGYITTKDRLSKAISEIETNEIKTLEMEGLV